MTTFKYLFGPVPSRRLGMSLGVDLVPSKVCSMNCVYCECGPTTRLTLERREHVPSLAVIDELRTALREVDNLDCVTFSGAGEPTLHSGIGEVVRFVKTTFPEARLCLLTNGASLGDPTVIEDVKGVDLVIPSLDAVTEEDFQRINRPAKGLTVKGIIDGIRRFRMASSATLWLEIFVVPGVTIRSETVQLFAEAVRHIAPDKVQINTLDRPGSVVWVHAAAAAEITPLVEALTPFVSVEVTGKFNARRGDESLRKTTPDLEVKLLELASRRPMTSADMAASLGLGENSLAETLHELEISGRLRVDFSERGKFYRTKTEGAK